MCCLRGLQLQALVGIPLPSLGAPLFVIIFDDFECLTELNLRVGFGKKMNCACGLVNLR